MMVAAGPAPAVRRGERTVLADHAALADDDAHARARGDGDGARGEGATATAGRAVEVRRVDATAAGAPLLHRHRVHAGRHGEGLVSAGVGELDTVGEAGVGRAGVLRRLGLRRAGRLDHRERRERGRDHRHGHERGRPSLDGPQREDAEAASIGEGHAPAAKPSVARRPSVTTRPNAQYTRCRHPIDPSPSLVVHPPADHSGRVAAVLTAATALSVVVPRIRQR